LDSPLIVLYRAYLECLNSQAWEELSRYIDTHIAYNGEVIGLDAYRQARKDEFRSIPDLYFNVKLLVANEKVVACRLDFTISPMGDFLGLPVNGQSISFSENVFYEYEAGKIVRVWSLLDRAAIERQVSRP